MPLRSGHETFPFEGRYPLGSILLETRAIRRILRACLYASQASSSEFLGFEFLHARDSNTVAISLSSLPPFFDSLTGAALNLFSLLFNTFIAIFSHPLSLEIFLTGRNE